MDLKLDKDVSKDSESMARSVGGGLVALKYGWGWSPGGRELERESAGQKVRC